MRAAYILGSALVRGGSTDEGVGVLTSAHDVQLRVLGSTHPLHTQQTLSELERARPSSSVQQPKKRRVGDSP